MNRRMDGLKQIMAVYHEIAEKYTDVEDAIKSDKEIQEEVWDLFVSAAIIINNSGGALSISRIMNENASRCHHMWLQYDRWHATADKLIHDALAAIKSDVSRVWYHHKDELSDFYAQAVHQPAHDDDDRGHGHGGAYVPTLPAYIPSAVPYERVGYVKGYHPSHRVEQNIFAMDLKINKQKKNTETAKMLYNKELEKLMLLEQRLKQMEDVKGLKMFLNEPTNLNEVTSLAPSMDEETRKRKQHAEIMKQKRDEAPIYVDDEPSSSSRQRRSVDASGEDD